MTGHMQLLVCYKSNFQPMNSIFNFLSMVCAGLLTFCSCACQNYDNPVVVFQKGESGYDTYRIPALIQTKLGTLLAFAEARKNGPGDTGDIDLVVKHSYDGGKTWGDIIKVWDDRENVCGNPSPVVDCATGRIILIMTWNDGRDKERAIHAKESFDFRHIFVCYSDDDGANWSTPNEISHQVRNEDWTWYATGPCHAIQLRNGKQYGRIIVPCNHGVYDNGPKGTVSHVIYSDDVGESWNIGAVLPIGNESTIAELSDGKLMLNMRGQKSEERVTKPYRWAAISNDGGESFNEPYLDEGLIEPVCNASIINWSPPFSSLTNKILFSNPADVKKRINMTVYLSNDDGKNWRRKWSLPGKYTAYSDLCVMSDGSPCILYESGDDSPYDAITFCRLRY